MTDEYEDHRPWSPKLREAAVNQFSTEWGVALDQTGELHRTFERLADALRALAEQGSLQTLVFADELAQKWWIAFREARGDLVPGSPENEPPAMKHEDLIVAEHSRAK